MCQIAAALGLAIGAAAGPVKAQTIETFGNPVKLVKLSSARLTGNTRRHYQGWQRQKGYFGAFAYNTAEEASFGIMEFHDLETAKQGALVGCQIVSKSSKNTCVLYAVVLPKSLPSNTASASGLGRATLKAFTNDYQRRQKPGTHSAFAINGLSDYGYSTRRGSEAEAIETALSFCDRGAAIALSRLNTEGRAWIKARGLEKCRVIHKGK